MRQSAQGICQPNSVRLANAVCGGARALLAARGDGQERPLSPHRRSAHKSGWRVLASALILRGLNVQERLDQGDGADFGRDLEAGVQFLRERALLVSLAAAVGCWVEVIIN